MMSDKNGDPLTKAEFFEWRDTSFDPHVEREEETVSRLGEVEKQISVWVKVVIATGSVITIIGGAFLALLSWNLTEKNAQIQHMQTTVHDIAANQKVAVATLGLHNEELKRQAVAGTELSRLVIDIIRDKAKTK